MKPTEISVEVWRNEDDRPLIIACTSRLDGEVYVATAPACFSHGGDGRVKINPCVTYAPPSAIVNNVERLPSIDYVGGFGSHIQHIPMREFVSRFGGTLTERRPR